MGFLKILAKIFGVIFILVGTLLSGYNVYWSITRKASILGLGFALIFIIVGLILLGIGVFLIIVSRK